MGYRARLTLLFCALVCGAALLALAQEQIATAAALVQTSADFDATALLTFDPAAVLHGEDLIGGDEEYAWEPGAVDDLSAGNDGPAGMTSAPPQSVGSDPAAEPGMPPVSPPEPNRGAPTGSTIGSPAGWPRTTAETVLAAAVAKPPTADRWIDINLARQTVTAYMGSTPLKTVLTATGTRVHPTVVGTFRVWAKVKSQTMRGGSRARHDYYSLPGVPNILYFYRGYSLHGTYWHRNFGHVMSHGCANLTLADAAWLYDWASVGTIVRTHY
jgi:lipoprotein-anchoring transpeptidase ErfK/SrfK